MHIHEPIPMSMDFMKPMLLWIAEDEQIALDNAGELVLEINEAIRALEYQREAIESLRAYLDIKLHPERAEPVKLGLRPDERVGIIKKRVGWLLAEGHTTITPQMVLDRLETDYLDLGVTHPTSVIATVMAKMVEFRRVRQGVFEYTGVHKSDDGVYSIGPEREGPGNPS